MTIQMSKSMNIAVLRKFRIALIVIHRSYALGETMDEQRHDEITWIPLPGADYSVIILIYGTYGTICHRIFCLPLLSLSFLVLP